MSNKSFFFSLYCPLTLSKKYEKKNNDATFSFDQNGPLLGQFEPLQRQSRTQIQRSSIFCLLEIIFPFIIYHNTCVETKYTEHVANSMP